MNHTAHAVRAGFSGRCSGLPKRLTLASALHGYTLLEALVACVVLSFGALGLAGLQAVSLKVSREAQQQATAVQLAREYSELMRNNLQVASRTQTNGYLIAETEHANHEPGSNCSQQACSASELASWEVYEWQSRLFTVLPSARLAVCFDTDPYDDQGLAQWSCQASSSAGRQIAIKIGWRQAAVDAEGEVTFQQALVRPLLIHLLVPGGES